MYFLSSLIVIIVKKKYNDWSLYLESNEHGGGLSPVSYSHEVFNFYCKLDYKKTIIKESRYCLHF